MKITRILFASTVAAQIMFASCKKTNDVSASSSANTAVDYQLQVSNTTVAINQRIEAGNLQWTSGTASPTLLKFEAKKGAIELEFKSKSTQRINLFTPLGLSLGNVTLPAGMFDEVEFKIQLDKNGSDPALELNGQFAGSAGNIPVFFKVNDPLEIKAEKNNVTITANNINTALTTLDLSKITAGITQTMLSNAQLTNGSIVISSSSNINLYNTIISNLDRFHSCEVGHR